MAYESGVSNPALAIGAMTPAERAAGRYMRAPDHGGAADALNDDPADAPPADAPPADAPPADAPPADPEWFGELSEEGGDADNPSNRDWVKALAVKDLDGLAKIARDNQKAARGKGIQVPGDGAKPEEIAAFHKAIGVPENAEGYAVELPEGVKEDEIDMDLLNGLRAKALEAGVPAQGFKALVAGVIQQQFDTLAASRTAENGSRDELFKEWGPQKDAKMADVNNGMRALGLKTADVTAMQRGFAMQYGEPGSRRTLELLQKIGAGTAEDALLGGDGPRRFGITGAEAQKEIDVLTADKEFGKRLLAKDPEAVARWDRLNAAVAAEKDRKARADAAG